MLEILVVAVNRIYKKAKGIGSMHSGKIRQSNRKNYHISS
jgi:hypothetical protein